MTGKIYESLTGLDLVAYKADHDKCLKDFRPLVELQAFATGFSEMSNMKILVTSRFRRNIFASQNLPNFGDFTVQNKSAILVFS